MLLVQNTKMKNSSINGLKVYNFGIPAFRSKDGLATCPNAGVCASGCYAKSGAYLFSNVANAYETRFKVTLSTSFIKSMCSEIDALLKKKSVKQLVIRIHDSGDFYSAAYLTAWLNIMIKYPGVTFYAYTKMIDLFKGRLIPSNFKIIYSLGGRLDALINQDKDRHSKVFETVDDLNNAGYIDVSSNDMLALGESKKIGLVFHHAKKFSNTAWSKVQ